MATSIEHTNPVASKSSLILPGGMEFTRAEFDMALRADFVSFIQQCVHTLLPNVKFLPNWHITSIAHHLDLVRKPDCIRRLIINLPPRSLKSIIASVAFPAFVLGHDPTARLIVASYGSELSVKLGNDCRAIMNSDWYRRIFPGTRISKIKNTEYEFVTTKGGFRLATSVGGTLTGRGGDIIIVDDPLKPQDAFSDSKRESANDWFDNTLLSRLDDKKNGRIVVVAQRLHVDDLSGKLLRPPSGWDRVILPAIAEHDEEIPIDWYDYHHRRAGDLLHPEREPLPVLEAMRTQLGSDIFSAQYQQCPIPPGGNMIKRNWVLRYDEIPVRKKTTRVIQSWDTAQKEGGQNDWSVCTTWLIHEKKYYLIDVVRGRYDYPSLKARALAQAERHKPTNILIEDTGVGTALVAELRAAGLTAIAVKPEGNKVARMSVESAKFESGQVLLPKQAPWLDVLEMELFAFPGCRHDDQIDSISQALGHKIQSSWADPGAVEGYGDLVQRMAFDAFIGRVTGRPW